MAVEIDLGAVVPIGKGDWNSETIYERANMVRHNSSSWVCKVKQSQGKEPMEGSSDWYLLVKDTSSVTSVNGQKGDVTLDITHSATQPLGTKDTTNATTEFVQNELDSVKGTLDEVNQVAKKAVTKTDTSVLPQANKIPIAEADGKLNEKWFPEGFGSGKRTLGDIFVWPLPTPPEGAIICNGNTVSRELYADLYNYANSQKWIIPESEWESIASTNNGYCNMYSQGNNLTTFRLPKLAPYVKVTNTPSEAGKYFEAGIPDITGSFDSNYLSDSFYEINGTVHNGTGAFRTKVDQAKGKYASLSLTELSDAGAINNFKASRESPVYGKSSTVQPESMNWIVCVQAFGVAENIGNVDVANVVNALNDKVNTDLSNAPNIVTTNTEQVISAKKEMLARLCMNGINNQSIIWFKGADKASYGFLQDYSETADRYILELGLESLKNNSLARVGLYTNTYGTTFKLHNCDFAYGCPTPSSESNDSNFANTAWVRARLAEKGSQVVDAWHSGSSWYRKYSDGFIIQGGTRASQQWAGKDYIMTLHIPFATTDYYASVKGTYGRGETTGYNYFACYNKTISNFKFVNSSDKYMGVYWIALGY